MPAATDKVRENRLRRAAARQGYALRKIRRLDPRARDYGRFVLRSEDDVVVFPDNRWGATLDDVERWLRGEEVQR